MSLKAQSFMRGTTTDIGNGDLTVLPASGYNSVSNIGNGHQTYVMIRHRETDEWEISLCTINVGGTTTITRNEVMRSSTGTSKVVFTAGTKDVYVDLPGELMAELSNLSKVSDLSTSSVEIGEGSRTFAVKAGKLYTAGLGAFAFSYADPTNRMYGRIDDYYEDAGTWYIDMTVGAGSTGGSGTYADWIILMLGSPDVVIGTDVQAWSAKLDTLAALSSVANLSTLAALSSVANLSALAGLTLAADKLPYATGAGAMALADLTTAGRALLDDANAAAQRTTLGLGALAILSSVVTIAIDDDAVTYAKIQNVTDTDKLLGRSSSGAGIIEEIACTAAGRALLDDANAAAQRTTLGLGALATQAASAVDITGGLIALATKGLADFGRCLVNGTLAASVGSNALTVAIKTLAGSDPSASDPVYVVFRNATAATGDFTVITLTAATSFVVSSGSTLGTSNSTPFKLWVVGFNDGGTFRIGIVNCLNGTDITPLGDDQLAGSTAEGGAGAADSAGVFYTGTAVSAKAYRILGYLEYGSGLGTAGTWTTAPTKVQLFGPGVHRPGDVIQRKTVSSGAVVTGANTTPIPVDDTIPQNTEGDQFLSTLTIVPTSAANLLSFEGTIFLASTSAGAPTAALFQDSDASAMIAVLAFQASANNTMALPLRHLKKAGSTSSQDYKVRGGNVGGTTTMNGSNGTRIYGGALISNLTCEELAA